MSSSAFIFIIEKYFSRNGGWLRLKGEMAVYYWPRVAGEEIAKKVEAVRYRSGFLYLQTEIPALAQQIMLMIPSLLEKYQIFLGKGVLKGIKIKIGTIKQGSNLPTGKVQVVLEKNDTEAIEKCQKEISDSELAAKFAQFMQKSYINHKNIKAGGGKACMSCGVTIDAAFNYCPCCEQKVNEEIKAYLKYQKKHNPGLNQDDPGDFAGLSHLRI